MRTWHIHNHCTIYQVLGGRSNAYLIATGKGNILFDTGKTHARKRLLQNLHKLPIPAHSIDLIVLSHTHFDHCQNARYLQQRYHCAIVADEEESTFVRSGFTPIAAGTSIGFRLLSRLANYLHLKSMSYLPFDLLPRQQATALLHQLDAQLQILPTRGHTQGSICLLLAGHTALVGDTVLGYWGKALFPPFAEHPDLVLHAWQQLLDSPCHTFLPGHGRAVSRTTLEQSLHKIRTKITPS